MIDNLPGRRNEPGDLLKTASNVLNQTAGGRPTLKGWGMLRAARSVSGNPEIVESCCQNPLGPHNCSSAFCFI